MFMRKYVTAGVMSFILMLPTWASADTQFRLIVDASGSMLINDPDKLTAEALTLISDLAPEQRASLGVWLFGERSRVLLPESLINRQTKSQLNDVINRYQPGDLKTDLESVIRLLLQTPDGAELAPDFERHWILVTDGMVDVSLDDAVNEASRTRIRSDLAEELAERGIHLHTISMTGYTDQELLQSVSTLTDATHTEVATPEALLDTFDRIFSQAAPSEEVPFDGNTFFIDESIDEATLLVFHQEQSSPAIYDPSGQRLNLEADNVSAVKNGHYTLATVTKPAVGTWRVENVDLERSSIRVITNLSAQATKIAPVLFVNEPIYSTVGLFQDSQLINDAQILNLVSVEQKLNLLSGQSSKQLMQRPLPITNNQFKNKVEQITAEGNYELISEVDGQTFVRQLSQFFSVSAPIDFEAEKQSENLVAFSAKPTNLRLNMMRSNARLILTYNDGTEESLEMPIIGAGFWQKIYPIAPNSSLTAHVRLIGVTQTGVRFEYSTQPWIISRASAGAVTISKQQEPDVPDPTMATAVLNRDLMPVVVTPQISVVENPEAMPDEAPAGEPEAAPQDASDALAEDAEATQAEPEGLDASDWILYGVINGVGLLLIVGGYLIVRRIRKKRKQPLVIEDSDV